MFTQSFGCTAEGSFARVQLMKREWGVNPLRITVGVCVECFCVRWRKPVIGKPRRQNKKMWG